ncbi:hypothetical protein B0H66DRAFT_604070 [Apodospora peruviana]|uniref:Transmembrane protein n=1 Tax=Apodospora peruviana TaxID=516989 RepID=A0AAE0HZH6_9PEZI|nr:hypothetical protein B0H66DRAFT_604070 [Apodospora peruviana]
MEDQHAPVSPLSSQGSCHQFPSMSSMNGLGEEEVKRDHQMIASTIMTQPGYNYHYLPQPAQTPISPDYSAASQQQWSPLSPSEPCITPTQRLEAKIAFTVPAASQLPPKQRGFLRHLKQRWPTMYFFLFAWLRVRNVMRYGTAFAVVTKFSLAAAVTIAFRQQLWVTLLQPGQDLSLRSLDSIFAATEDISSMFNFTFYHRSDLFPSVYMYLLHDVTMDVNLQTPMVDGFCPSIRTLNFSREALVLAETTTGPSDLFQLTHEPLRLILPEATYNFQDTLLHALLMGHEVVVRTAGNEICGKGWTWSYLLSFVGPGYKCTEQLDAAEADDDDDYIPDGDRIWKLSTSLFTAQFNVTFAFRNPADADGPSSSSPVEGSMIGNREENYASSNAAAGPHKRSSFTYAHREKAYTVSFSYSGDEWGSQTATVLDRVFLATIVPYFIPFNDPPLNWQEELSKNGARGTYNGMSEKLVSLLGPSVGAYHPGSDVSHFVQSKLFDARQYVDVVWASDPSNSSGTVVPALDERSTDYPCMRWRTLSVFKYNVMQLWLVYGVSMLLALLGVGVGSKAIWGNGGQVRNTRFSTILEAVKDSSDWWWPTVANISNSSRRVSASV